MTAMPRTRPASSAVLADIGVGGGMLMRRFGIRLRAHHVLDLILVERRHADAAHAAHAGERLRELLGGLEAPRGIARAGAREPRVEPGRDTAG